MLSRREILASATLVAAPGMALAQTPPLSPSKGDGVVSIPVELTRNLLWTPVWTNSKGPYRCLIDTGAAFFSIEARLAVEAGLHAAGHRVRLRTHQGDQEGDYWDSYYADQIVIGGALAQKNVVFEAEPHSGFIQGGVPGAILLTTPTKLDFAERSIDLYFKGRPDTDGYDRLPMTPLEAKNLEILRQLDGAESALVIEAALDGVPLRLQVRTGAQQGVLLYAHAVDRLKLWDKYPKWASGDGRWGLSTTYWGKLVHQPYSARLVRGGALTLGAAAVKAPVVALVDPTETEHQDLWWAGNRKLQVDGYIGMETLRRFSIVLDADKSAVWLKPNGALNQPFRYNRSGLRFKVENRSVVVTAVKPASPAAEAGVQADDEILASGKDVSPAAFGWDISDVPGAVVEFDVMRGGVKTPTRMVLKELI